LIYAGGNLNAGGYLAPIFRLARIEQTGTQVSARAQIGWLRGAALTIPRFLSLAQTTIAEANNPADAAQTIGQGIISGGLTRTALSGVDTFTMNGEITAAQALGEMFGLQGAVTFQRRVVGATLRNPIEGSFRDSATRYDMIFDLSFEWDGNSKKIPIAAMASYELNARLGGTGDELLEQDSSNVHTFGLGLYYSGRQDLQVGLFGATVLNLRSVQGIAGASGVSGAPSAAYGQMIIRYVW
jgi:hypothetical protein